MPPAEAFEPIVLVELPPIVPPLSHLRGTALVSSFQVLGEMGLRDEVLRSLAPEYSKTIRDMTASTWVEIDLAMVYYRALDALNLPSDQIVLIGMRTAERVQSAFLATLLRGLRGVMTPVHVLSRMDRFWTRSSRGGAPRVVQLAPREARVEAHGAEFLDLRYNRIALMGYYQQALAPTAKTLSVRELARPGPSAAAWVVSWA